MLSYLNLRVVRQFAKMTELMAVGALAEDNRFRTNKDRVANRGELIPLLSEIFATGSVCPPLY